MTEEAQAKDLESCCPPPAEPDSYQLQGQEADERLARSASALGHPTRVAILRLLLRRDQCICGEIVDELPYAQSTISQHLKKMKEAGLIRGDVDGPRTCYCVEPGILKQFKVLVAAL